MTSTTSGLHVSWSAIAAVGLIAAIAYLMAEAGARVARLAIVSTLRREAGVAFMSPIVRRPMRIVRLVVFVATFGALIAPALTAAGIPVAIGPSPAALGAWAIGPGVRLLGIALVAYVLVRMIAAGSRRIEDEICAAAPDQVERAKRGRTLSRLVQSALTVSALSVAGLMMLRELNVDVMPVLTGAGIVGLAVGFGAQTLVKDLIAGFFLILEDQVRVGDVAVINGTGGLVEAINLRTIVLRDLEGVVHVFPNGSIERLANRTKDYSYAVIDVGVAYKEDSDRVMDVLREVGDALASDPVQQPSLLGPLEVFGVDAFGDSQVTIKVRIKTVPLKQWDVGRELRRRIKKTFDTHQIEIPFPHLSVYFGERSKPFVVQRAG